jgi:Ca2+-binding EF-hand superfamily protein
VRRRQEEIQFIFDLLDEDSSGALSLAEFFDLVEVAQVGTR